jgi:hypothetical protein
MVVVMMYIGGDEIDDGDDENGGDDDDDKNELLPRKNISRSGEHYYICRSTTNRAYFSRNRD